MTHNFCRKKIRGCLTIPSGIVTTQASALELIAREVPEIGILITKSIGLEPRDIAVGDEVTNPKSGKEYSNREPIIAEKAPGTYCNAVGLRNPGAAEFAQQLSKIKLPPDVFLLASVFGRDEVEFAKTARLLEPYADGFELNLSCPHAEGVGKVVGQNPELIYNIIDAVMTATLKPVVVKLSPDLPNLPDIVDAILAAKADAISGVNTLGSDGVKAYGYDVLCRSGMSGRGLYEYGLRFVKSISSILKSRNAKIPILAMGGIRNAIDIRQYQSAGASFFGIGSALAGLSTEEIKQYFNQLGHDMELGTNRAESILKADYLMKYEEFEIVKNQRLAQDLAILTLNKEYNAAPGQFVFVWMPGVGEKPFSVFTGDPLALAVQKKGYFSSHLYDLEGKQKDELENNIYVRGPYGRPVTADKNKHVLLIGGGTGIAALLPIARFAAEPVSVLGAKDSSHVLCSEAFERLGPTFVFTEDGSEGDKGMVTDYLKQIILGYELINPVCFVCGPKQMQEETLKIISPYVSKRNQYVAIDYMTMCGIGLCGSCATEAGYRSCVDGPFMDAAKH